MADYFAMAARDAAEAFHPKKTTDPRLLSHWSWWDAPQWALCGERIEPKQFARDPSCPDCQLALQRMKDEDIR